MMLGLAWIPAIAAAGGVLALGPIILDDSLSMGQQVGAETVRTLDGREIAGTLVAVGDREVTVRTAAGAEKVERTAVRSIAFAAEPPDLMAAPGRHVLVTQDSSRVAVEGVTIQAGRLQAATGFGPKVELPLEQVVRLLRPRADQKPADLERERQRLGLARSPQDTLVVALAAGPWTPVTGILLALEDGKVRFNYEGTDSVMDAPAVVIIEMARTGDAAAPEPARAREPAGRLTTRDGSRLSFTALAIAGGSARVQSASLGALRIETARLAEVRFSGGERLVYLSSLDPAGVRQTPFFDEAFPWQRDRAVGGGPIRLGGVAYEKGLGLHARCELLYHLGGAYRWLTATVGIDDAVRMGAAELSILADSKPLLRLRLDRAAPPRPIRLDVQGAAGLTILVDFVENTFGAGACVSLGDAALTK